MPNWHCSCFEIGSYKNPNRRKEMYHEKGVSLYIASHVDAIHFNILRQCHIQFHSFTPLYQSENLGTGKHSIDRCRPDWLRHLHQTENCAIAMVRSSIRGGS